MPLLSLTYWQKVFLELIGLDLYLFAVTYNNLAILEFATLYIFISSNCVLSFL